VAYAFGEFELDPASYELRVRGQSVALQPKVLELLSYLAERRGRVVAKRELLSALWPDVHVSESSLAWCVSQARKALDQKRGDRGPIETVHGRGYRFAADVQAVDAPARGKLEDAPTTAASAGGANEVAPAPREARSVFIGRRAAMGSLRGALRRANTEQRGAGYLLLGEAGIGKTRCAEELAGEALAAGTSAWVGRCLEADGTPALWPWIRILRECVRERADDPTGQLAEALLADLIPREAAALDPAFMNGRSEGFWVLDRLVRFLIGAAERRPRLVVLDDLQWADRQSLRALELVLPDLDRHAILLVATVRDTDAPSHPSCVRSLDRLRRHFTNVPLSGFRPDEVEEYLAATTGRAPAADLVTAMHQKTGGNPLFVQEMAQRLLEHPAGATGDLGELAGARTFMLARLERRDPRTLEVLEAASALGESFDLSVLAAMRNVPPVSLVPLLDAGIQARLIERRAGVGAYAFVHAVVRDAVHSGLADAARCSWHRRAGEVLEARAIDDEHLTQLAFHFYEALPAGTHAEAARYAAAAAQAAARIFAHDDARTQWNHALQALDFHPDGSADTRVAVLVGLAGTELNLGLRTESRERLKQAIALARRRDNPTQLVAAARVLRHSLLSHISIDPLARGAIESALPMLSDECERASALSLLGAVHPGAPSHAQAREASERALASARTMGGQTLLEALWSRTFSLAGPGDVRALLDVCDEMLRLDASLGRSWWSGEALYAQFCAYSYLGDTAGRDRALDELGALAVACRLPEAQWHHDRLRAQIALQTGAFDEASRSWKELAERKLLANLGYVKTLVAMHPLALDVERAETPGARYELWRALSSWTPGPRAQALLMVSLVEAGRHDEARVHFDDAAARGFASLPRDRSFLSCLASLAVVAIALEDREHAAALEAMLEPYASFNAPDVLASSLGSVAHYLGLVAQFLGRGEVARERFELALVRNREMGLRPHLARTELAFAKMLSLDPGTSARAASLVRSAASTAQELGMLGVAGEANDLQRSL
jgi:DNA-binding winged helix-turn-helix (wHTH) protein/tetratricopeptide (TPR) repeat protein